MAALQIFTGDTHAPVSLGARGVTYLVIMLLEIFQSNMYAELYVAVKTKIGARCNSVEHLGDRLDLLMVRGDPGTHQTERGWQTIKHIQFVDKILLSKQVISNIKPAGASTNNGHSQRICVSTYLCHEMLLCACPKITSHSFNQFTPDLQTRGAKLLTDKFFARSPYR